MSRETVFWSALACAGALLVLVVWWNSGEREKTTGKKEAVGSPPKTESRPPLGEWMSPWGFFTGKQGSPAERSAGWELKEIEDAVRRAFLAYNEQDLQAFKAGWTDKGFQQAYGFPKENATDFGLLSLLSFRPYIIGEFSNTSVNGKSAVTEVGLTYGDVQESHRMALVREDDTWKIDHDEKLALIPKDATVVDAKLKFFIIELERTRLAPGPAAFRITNSDTRPHEFIVKRWIADSDMEETIGMTKPLKPGEHATLVLNLGPGRYVVLCNLVGRDGMPLSYGMRTEFTIQ